MQAAAPEAVDLSNETDETKKLYGLDEPATEPVRPELPAGAPAGRARRALRPALLRRRQRMGRPPGHRRQPRARWCRATDKPIAGLLTDLKGRGLLDDTLVVWGGEFGRTPINEKGDGRDHNPYGFTMWMAGGGIKGGQAIGATDELGLRAVDKPSHVHDLHATILHLLGLDHLRLTFPHNGRGERATINGGNLITELF